MLVGNMLICYGTFKVHVYVYMVGRIHSTEIDCSFKVESQ